ncbi:MAG: sulfatase-like hydrolase/transferase, partial [Planctomycetota bacterium]
MKRLLVCLFLVGVSYAAPRPNIVLIMVDDMGWSDIGCYGSEISTPNLDNLANNGVRFREFYNTSKCFPTRACLLTGVYAHQNGFDNDYGQFINSVTLGEVLGGAGYHTYASGKHHAEENESLYQRGFEHYYGLLEGACNHFNPGLKRSGEPEPARKGNTRWWVDDSLVFNTRSSQSLSDQYFPSTFYSTDAFTAKAIEYLTEWDNANTGNPFFLYLSYTAPHDPLMAWPSDIAKYEGDYDVGYDAIRNARYQKQQDIGLINASQYPLTPSNYGTPASPTADEANRMEVYAAMIDRVDQKIGELVATLNQIGAYDDTLILFCADNGANDKLVNSADVDDDTLPIGSVGRWESQGKSWANVSNAPFQYFKNDSEEGGIRTPLIAHWPNGIVDPNRFTDKTGHMIDFMATFVELAGADYPRFYGGTGVTPMQGESFTDVLYNQTITPHSTLYFEFGQGRAVRDGEYGDYKLVSRDSGSTWKLFDMSNDATELDDLSASYPAIKSSLLTKFNIWWTAVNNNELPTAYDDSAMVAYPGSVDINVLSNDTDSDGTINASTLVITRDPANGTAVINPDDTIKYTATEGFSTDEFFYQVRDNDGEVSNEGRVTILPPNTDAPTPNPATFASAPSADSDTAISMTATTGTDASGPV